MACINHSVCADDSLLIAKSKRELACMCHVMLVAIAVEALYFRDEKLQLWSNSPGQPIKLGQRRLLVSACMVFLGA